MTFWPTDIVLASGNAGKLCEFRELLRPLHVTLRPQSDLGVGAAIESGATFVENAIIKARHAAACTGHAAIADDSGIVVDALAGAPGICSARYAGAGASDDDNLSKLLANAVEVEDGQRQCRFICVIAFLSSSNDPLPVLAIRVWEGELLREPRGENGFGYDPVFYVPEHDCSSAELEPALKNHISHRAKAMDAFLAEYHARFH